MSKLLTFFAHATAARLPQLKSSPTQRLIKITLTLVTSLILIGGVLSFFALQAQQVQAASQFSQAVEQQKIIIPPLRPSVDTSGVLTVAHTASTSHRMHVFNDGKVTNYFESDNGRNQIDQNRDDISATTIAVMFHEHPITNPVDVGAQGDFSSPTPIILHRPSLISGYSENSQVVYSSKVLSYQITQRTLSRDRNQDDWLVMELTISNTGETPLTQGRLLYRLDIDAAEVEMGDIGINDYLGRHLILNIDHITDTQDSYAMGMAVLAGEFKGYGINGTGYPISDLGIKSELLTPTSKIIAGNNNVSWFVVGLPTIPPHQETKVAFGLCAKFDSDSQQIAINQTIDCFERLVNVSFHTTAIPDNSIVAVSQPITYIISVSSTGSYPLKNLVITERIPLSTELVSLNISTGNITQENGLVIAEVGDLTATAGLVTVTLVVKPQTSLVHGSIISNQAFIQSDSIVTATQFITHRIVKADLAINKQVKPVSVMPGQPVTYTLTYTNQGPGVAAGTIITDLTPIWLLTPTFTSNPPLIAAGNISYIWPVGQLANGAGGVITITGRISPDLTTGGSLLNKAEIWSSFDATLSNNTREAPLTLTLPILSFSAPVYSYNEGVVEENLPALITVTLSPPNPHANVTVVYSTSNGTAVAGQDYQEKRGQLIFAAGQSEVSFTIPIMNDSTAEDDETIHLSLSDPVGASLSGSGEAILRIEDNDNPGVALSPANIINGVTEDGVTQVYSLSLTSRPNNPVTIAFTTGLQIEAIEEIVFNSSNWSNKQQVIVEAKDDDLVEGDHQAVIQHGVSSNDPKYHPNLATPAMGVNIQDNDVDLVIKKSISSNGQIQPGQRITYTLTYTNEKVDNKGIIATGVVITETLPPQFIPLSVSSSGALLTPANSLSSAWQVADLGPGEGGRIVIAGLISPLLAEEISLINRAGITTADQTEVDLTDNLAQVTTFVSLPRISFDKELYAIAETASQAIVTMTLTPAPLTTVSVTLSSLDGSATAGSDYGLVSRVITFSPGIASMTATVLISNDDANEGEENFELFMHHLVGLKLGSPATTTLTIINDDFSEVFISDTVVKENNGITDAIFTVTLSLTSTRPTTLYYATADGTAVTPTDYLPILDGVLTFTSIMTENFLHVKIKDDKRDEQPFEEFYINLVGASDNLVISEATGIGKIIDDDEAGITTTITPPNLVNVSEKGIASFYSVALNSQPATTVTVNFSINDRDNDSQNDVVRPSPLTFTPDDWSTHQVVKVSAEDDKQIEGVHSVTISHTVDSNDPKYMALTTPSLVGVSITDNDIDLSISSQLEPNSSVQPGQRLTYTLKFLNNNSRGVDVEDIVIQDLIPSVLTQVKVISNYPGLKASSSQSYTWELDQLDANKGGIITISGMVDPDLNAEGNLFNQASITTTTALLDEVTPEDNTTQTNTAIVLPIAHFSSPSYTVSETAPTAIITVTLKSMPLTTVTVNLTSSNGTAISGKDYGGIVKKLTFSPHISSLTVTIPISQDSLIEEDETVSLTLGQPSRLKLGIPSTATLTLVDDDRFTIDFNAQNYSVNENVNLFTIPVTLNPAASQPLQVDYIIQNHTATADDYKAVLSDTLIFSPGQTTQNIPISIINDKLDELTETLTLSLTNVIFGVKIGNNSPAELTITDNDAPLVYLPIVLKHPTICAYYGPKNFPLTNAEKTLVSQLIVHNANQYVLEVKVPADSNTEVGLIFGRISPTQYYRFGIIGSREDAPARFRLKWQDGPEAPNSTCITSSSPDYCGISNDSINSSTNHLKIECNIDRIRLYLNNGETPVWQDDNFACSGGLGSFLQSEGGSGPVTRHFTGFQVECPFGTGTLNILSKNSYPVFATGSTSDLDN